MIFAFELLVEAFLIYKVWTERDRTRLFLWFMSAMILLHPMLKLMPGIPSVNWMFPVVCLARVIKERRLGVSWRSFPLKHIYGAILIFHFLQPLFSRWQGIGMTYFYVVQYVMITYLYVFLGYCMAPDYKKLMESRRWVCACLVIIFGIAVVCEALTYNIIASNITDSTIWTTERADTERGFRVTSTQGSPNIFGYVNVLLAILILTLAGLSIAVVNAMHNSLWSTYTVAATIPIAILMGLYMQIWRKGDVLGASLIGIVLLALCLLSGPWVAAHPELFGWLDIDRKPMSVAIPVYGFIASVLPVWLLLLPRDYLSTFLKIGTIGALALGIVFVMPDFNMPAFTEFTKGGGPIVGGPVIPFIFITIACGALSGFHATIGTGTTPKMIGKERDVLFVGYGAMLVEGFVAIMALIAACVLVPADYFAINAPADKFAALGMSVVDLPTLEKEVAESLMHRPGGSVSLAVGMAHIFGQIPWMSHLMSYWYHFAIMFEAVFILTAVDAGTRVGRFFLQEMIGKVIPKFGDKNWWPGIVVTSFLFTGAWGYLVYTGDISSIWPLFGISNQLLASVTLLIGTTMLLRMNKTKYAWITAAPGIFMTFITFWAGIWLIMYQYIPTQKYLLASLSVLVMVMMGFVIIGTLRRWSVLLKETKIVRDPYGDEVKEIVQE